VEAGHRLELPPLRVGRAACTDLLARRESLRTMGQPTRSDIALRTDSAGKAPWVVCTPPAARGRLIHFHGGGYRMGSAEAWTPFGARLAAATGLEIWLPDYALAPEAPFPAALHDALAVIEAASADSRPLLVGGDSAGGGLALSSTLVAAGANIPIQGLALISPWLDLTVTAASYEACAAADGLFSRSSALEAAESYLQGLDARNPLASPLFADLAAAPRTLILASANEVLRDDALSLAWRLATVGNSVQLAIEPGQPHVWPVLQPDTPQSRDAMRAIARFVDLCLAASSPSTPSVRASSQSAPRG